MGVVARGAAARRACLRGGGRASLRPHGEGDGAPLREVVPFSEGVCLEQHGGAVGGSESSQVEVIAGHPRWWLLLVGEEGEPALPPCRGAPQRGALRGD